MCKSLSLNSPFHVSKLPLPNFFLEILLQKFTKIQNEYLYWISDIVLISLFKIGGQL